MIQPSKLVPHHHTLHRLLQNLHTINSIQFKSHHFVLVCIFFFFWYLVLVKEIFVTSTSSPSFHLCFRGVWYVVWKCVEQRWWEYGRAFFVVNKMQVKFVICVPGCIHLQWYLSETTFHCLAQLKYWPCESEYFSCGDGKRENQVTFRIMTWFLVAKIYEPLFLHLNFVFLSLMGIGKKSVHNLRWVAGCV
jgi:hypothetical protein